MSESVSKDERVEAPVKPAGGQLDATNGAIPDPVRSVTGQLEELGLESRVLRNGWVIYAVDHLGPDIAVRPAKDDAGELTHNPWLTSCAVWEISEGGFRWVHPIVEELGRQYPHIDLRYRPEKGTVWASRRLESAEISTEQILAAMWELADASEETWKRIAPLGLGKRFHSAWLSEDLMPGASTLSELRPELLAPRGPGPETMV